MKQLVVTVHGIRTFGDWQERLEGLLRQRSATELEISNYKYGYFSIFAFLIPPIRWLVVRRFRKEFSRQCQRNDWDRIDIVAHSFGTHIAAWALHGISESQRPKVHTIVFAGSVLKSAFPWSELLGSCVRRVVNDCGIHDRVLVWNQIVVLFTGMAGRVGFAGMTGANLRNRFFPFAHSGYFLGENGPDNRFMTEKWVPLLTHEQAVETFPDPRESTSTSGVVAFLLNNIEPIKLTFYLSPVVVLFLTYLTLYFDAEAERVKANDARRVQAAQLRDASIRAEGTARTLMDNGDWARAVAYLGHSIALDPENVAARAFLWQALGPGLGAASNLPATSVNLPKGTRIITIGPHGETVTCHLDDGNQILVNVSNGEQVLLDSSRLDWRFNLRWKDYRTGHGPSLQVTESVSQSIDALKPPLGESWEFSPDKKTIAWAGDRVVYWQSLTQGAPRKNSIKLKGQIIDLWWSPTGRALAVAYGSGLLCCIETATGNLIGGTLQGLGEYPVFIWHPEQLKVVAIRPDSHFILHDWRVSSSREIGWWVDAKWFMLHWDKNSGPAYVGGQSGGGLIFGIFDEDLLRGFGREKLTFGELAGTSDRWEISPDLRWLDTGTYLGDRTVWGLSERETVKWLELPEGVVGGAHFSDDLTWVGYEKQSARAVPDKEILYLWPLLLPQRIRGKYWAKDRDANPAPASPDGQWLCVENNDSKLGGGNGFAIVHAKSGRRVTTPSFTEWCKSRPYWSVDGRALKGDTKHGEVNWPFGAPGLLEPWVPVMIEAASGWRFDSNGAMQQVSLDERLARRAHLRALRRDGPNPDVRDGEWRRLLEWWLSPFEKRASQP